MRKDFDPKAFFCKLYQEQVESAEVHIYFWINGLMVYYYIYLSQISWVQIYLYFAYLIFYMEMISSYWL